MTISRRRFLLTSALGGCSLAASPFVTPVTLAAAPWETRLVVIILRGGMDGLDVVQPLGDRHFAALRPSLSRGQDITGFFALHPALTPLLPLWRAGSLGFVHAVSTPYRDKRSHFDGQDLLEAGVSGGTDGWLNRMLQAVPGVTSDTAYAIDPGDMALLRGRAPVSNWSPDSRLTLSPQAAHLLGLVTESDPDLHAALSEALVLSETSERIGEAKGHVALAEYAAARLADEARIAAFSLNGWDTHRAQARGLTRSLERLAETLDTFEQRLPRKVWSQTAILAMTEFGRTARENGSGGTDHGTGGLMLMAGGAVRGGKVHGTWPGLAEEDLYGRRDLMPTGDVRTVAAWIMRGLFGLSRADLEGKVFPGMALGDDPGVLL